MRWFVPLVSVVAYTVGCSQGPEADGVPRGDGSSASAAMPAAAPARSAAKPLGHALAGTVVERISVTPYVYLRLQTATGELWVAVLEAPLTVGATVTVYNALLMEQFESKTLNRTFDRIYFGSLDAPGTAASAMASGDTGAMAAGTPVVEDAKVRKVDKANGADARTIGELWSQKAALSGKPVVIRGVVVKVNAGVMGKNWIHLQDGSGDAAAGTHDITVTMLDAAAVGATITVAGTVQVNRDVGAGYRFAVIVEDAKVVVK